MLLWPELRAQLGQSKLEVYALSVVTISFLNDHVPWIAERIAFEPIWRLSFPQYDALIEKYRAKDVIGIIISQELNGYDHKYYDLMFGEFVLYFNTSFWLLVICAVRLIYGADGALLVATLIIFPSSLIALFYTAPIYKMAYVRSILLMEELRPTGKLTTDDDSEHDE